MSPSRVRRDAAARPLRTQTIRFSNPCAAPPPPLAVETVPIIAEGRSALEKINSAKGLGFDDWDLDYYTDLFINKLGRDPTDVECFDMGQSNSEHSRHWFFGGKMVIDGEEKEDTLFRMVKVRRRKSQARRRTNEAHGNISRGGNTRCVVPR